MASYFNTGTDTALLHPSVRTHAELANIAAAAEYDVIQAYTYRVKGKSFNSQVQIQPDGPYYYTTEDYVVYLDGFNPDADHANVSALLKEALQRTIADVISHRILNINSAGGSILEEKRGRRTIKYADAKDLLYPEDWDSRLASFDLRPAFSI